MHYTSGTGGLVAVDRRRPDGACAFTRWQHFSVWNDFVAAILKLSRYISDKRMHQSMHIYFKNIPAKFHPDPIWNDGDLGVFTARCQRRARWCDSKSSVRPSVCLSVTFRYQQHIGWKSSKIISRPNSLRPLLWLTPNMGDLVQRKHPQN